MAELTEAQLELLSTHMEGSRWHIGSDPVTRINPLVQPSLAIKPKGLWYGVGSAWLEWCSDEGFEVPTTEHHLTEVTIPVSDQFLVITTLGELDEFHNSYPVARDGTWDYPSWPDLAAQYLLGMEISPYQWERRLDYSWYYAWDVASGVVWNGYGTTLTPRGTLGDVLRTLE